MSLFALLALLAQGGLRLGVRVWERSERFGGQLEGFVRGEQALRRLIETAYPALVEGQDGRYRVAFEGSATRMRFLAPVPPAHGEGGLAWFTLRVEGDEGKAMLLVEASPELSIQGVWPAPLSETLFAGARNLSFSYWVPAVAQREGHWSDTAPPATVFPPLIRIELEGAAPGIEGKLALRIAPRITVDATCLYDPLTRYCRGR